MELSEELSLQCISNKVQSFVGSISQMASNAYEGLLLTQALYLNVRHLVSGQDSCDALLIAKRWAEEDLSTEDLFLVEFLGTLTSSLQNVVERASLFILNMEIKCLELLLFTLTHLKDKESHSEPAKMLLRLVEKNEWTPPETVALLKALSEKYTEDGPVSDILMLVNVYDLSPEWTDDSGRSIIQALDFVGPEKFHLEFQTILRKQDENNLDSALTDLKSCSDVDDSAVGLIKIVISSVLRYSEDAPKVQPFMKYSCKRSDLSADDVQNCLSRLCKAVFDTKGWWPTVQHMLRWCVLVLTESGGPPELVGVEEEPCVTAMFAAAQVCMGNKLDIVLSSDIQSREHVNEWSDFYRFLGMSLNTNVNQEHVSPWDLYEADVVCGTMDFFISDYFHHGLEVMETGRSRHARGFIIGEIHNLEPSRLEENNTLVFAAETLKNLIGCFHSGDMEARNGVIKAIFQVLHMNLNKCTDSDAKIVTILQTCGGEALPPVQVYILNLLEGVLKLLRGEPEGTLCLESLFACAGRAVKREATTELFQKASSIVAQRLWSPVEVLNLLAALTDHYQDEATIMKILHLMETYQVSSEWTDEKNRSVPQLLCSSEIKNLIQHLEKSFRVEKEKSIDCLFDELRQMKTIDEGTLEKSYFIVKGVQNLIESGEMEAHRDVQQAKNLSHSVDEEDLQEILAVLCNAVHLRMAAGKWWPRATQMIGWCLLALSDTGKLLEMGTGEGKSCVIAMFAALRALRGEKVDVVSSSAVLCQRDAEEWANFYSYFGVTVDTNTNKNDDKHRKECYQKDVVYGTTEAFAADHIRQIFEMKDVRPDRAYQCIVIDEVDSLLLDQGVQLTYLSSPMACMQHLNVLLAMIWGHVSQYGFLTTGQETFLQAPPASFFKAIFDSIDTEGCEINDPMDILRIAEESQVVPEGFAEDMYKSEKEELFRKLKTVSQDAVVSFFQELEDYVPYGFTVYTLDDDGLLCLRKASPYNNWDIPELMFLVLEDGLCCALYESEETLIEPIATLISEKIQYTPCADPKDCISTPGFLRNLIDAKLPAWVQNAFLAKRLKQGREYVVENDSVCPVDFRSTGIVELNKKWGDGLQQFIEIKHQVKLSTVSTVTNYISNIAFFEKYHGKIYGTTGTLGTEADMLFLEDLYSNLSACKMPTFNRKKLFEVKGALRSSAEEWKCEIKQVVMSQITPNSYRRGRAALVICETINVAKEIHEELKNVVPGEVILYCRSDKDSLSKIEKELLPGDVIVATNLAGRGTDIKVSKEVNNNGGLFVILSFLSENRRVELQAFGRTARKGKPGSAQVIVTTGHLQETFRTVSSLEEAKETRDMLAAEKIHDMTSDVAEMRLREDLFSEYCETLQDIHRNTDGDEKRAVVAVMNEFWGIWLQTKSDEIDKLKRDELQKSLKADLSLAKIQSQSLTHHVLASTITSSLGILHWMNINGTPVANSLKKPWSKMSAGHP
ncbi:LOW QUALITY PROTEIN: uncharacterized protein LOC114773126 [Denticeps clupeoides]|uniref:LOW QUALITY PROTEIN: uncharacterized protein LOC114773126 n=1 Tax=Denticeps clupeoides TaxID=299321 RepID=UPI0010A4C275|nr:LOW QUALITY PROTEIN: uncharacterized protein LOC114773126 [Denticeps clupeoides]